MWNVDFCLKKQIFSYLVTTAPQSVKEETNGLFYFLWRPL